ncbi:hypothetical protein [Rhodococcus sp. 14-2470-1b]|uniref:hypothetical protein n=1 Tax=Rhodococcus sp. 14-2470-1b TaxID=2023149 RepID=UPI0015950E6A|nr:hypothetical protein [Rhodococcus sp. 14-2470-1b]
MITTTPHLLPPQLSAMSSTHARRQEAEAKLVTIRPVTLPVIVIDVALFGYA